LFETIVLSAIVSTMTMPVDAATPPRYANSASACWPSAIGSARTKVSGFTSPPSKLTSPPSAIGTTKMLMRSRYSGNSQIALLRWRSSTFSTTATWNWRGNSTIASIDRTVSQNRLP
jgi:hypothetical protein